MATGTDVKEIGSSNDLFADDPFAEPFDAEEVVVKKHEWAGSPTVNHLAEGIRAFATVLTEEECARQPQLAKAKKELKR